MIRIPTNKDLKIIEELNEQQDFRLRSLDCVKDIIYENDGNVIAYGTIKKMAEAIILLDKTASKVVRARAFKELLTSAIYVAKHNKFEQLHAFVSDPKVAILLEKKFDFVRSQDFVMVRNL